jgi:hypothetical protein
MLDERLLDAAAALVLLLGIYLLFQRIRFAAKYGSNPVSRMLKAEAETRERERSGRRIPPS